MKLLPNFKQFDSTHISNHIHQWMHCFQLVKAYVPIQLLSKWFVKYLLDPITEDVTKGGVMTKKQVIAHAQYLDLVYT